MGTAEIHAHTKRLDSLQGVRAIAFLGVFLYHAVRTFPGDGKLYSFFSLAPGPWGVSVFFMLSGFVMTYSYWNRAPNVTFRSSVSFAYKKIKRLYPLHLIMLLLGSVLLLLKKESIIKISAKLLITIPLLQTWFPIGYQAINTVAWYLSVCLFLYFSFPLILRIIKASNLFTSIASIIGVFLIQLLVGYLVFHYTSIDIKWVTYCHPLFRLGDFFIGGFIAYIYIYYNEFLIPKSEERSSSRQKKVGSIVLWTGLETIAIASNIFTCIWYTKSSEGAAWYTYSSLFIPTSICFILVFSLNKGIISTAISNRILFWVADISPYAFLIHRLVIYYFYYFTLYLLHLEEISFAIIIIIPFIITVATTYLYLAIEKRAKRLYSTQKAARES